MDKSRKISDDELELIDGAKLYVTDEKGGKYEAEVRSVGGKIVLKYDDGNGAPIWHFTERSCNNVFGGVEFSLLSIIGESKIINHTIALNPNERSVRR